MPLLLEFEFENGTKKSIKIPAEIWRYNENKASKVFYFDVPVKSVQLDPKRLTADTDTGNNQFPKVEEVSEFQQFKQNQN